MSRRWCRGTNVPPIAAITAPADGSDLLGPATIVGTASDANFLRYELAISPAGDEAWTVLAEGTAAVTNGALGTLDPSLYLNDLYTLRLTGIRQGPERKRRDVHRATQGQ